MNCISFLKPLLDAFKFIYVWQFHMLYSRTPRNGPCGHLYIKDKLNHEGVNYHMTSVLVYLLTSLLSTVRTQSN